MNIITLWQTTTESGPLQRFSDDKEIAQADCDNHSRPGAVSEPVEWKAVRDFGLHEGYYLLAKAEPVRLIDEYKVGEAAEQRALAKLTPKELKILGLSHRVKTQEPEPEPEPEILESDENEDPIPL